MNFFMVADNSDTGLCQSLTYMIVWFFVISLLLTIALILSWRYEQQTDMFLQSTQTLLGLPLKNYYKYTTDMLQYTIKITTVQLTSIIDIMNKFCKTQFEKYVNNTGQEL